MEKYQAHLTDATLRTKEKKKKKRILIARYSQLCWKWLKKL